MRSLLTLGALLVTLMLSACAGEQPVYRPVSVEVPVAESVKISPIKVPDFATGHVRISDGVDMKVRACFVELDQRKAYEARLVAQFNAFQ